MSCQLFARDKRGFTMMEIMIVIVIIGVLAGVAMLSYQRARWQSYYAQAANDIEEIAAALQLYYDDHGDYPRVGQKFSAYSSAPSWNTFGIYLKPYLPSIPHPGFEPIKAVQDYVYLKGVEGDPNSVTVHNSKTGKTVGCVTVNDGYWMDFNWSKDQFDVNLNDGGIDPDGIEIWSGDVEFNANGVACPSG
jgi:general secretion pathway protein G